MHIKNRGGSYLMCSKFQITTEAFLSCIQIIYVYLKMGSYTIYYLTFYASYHNLAICHHVVQSLSHVWLFATPWTAAQSVKESDIIHMPPFLKFFRLRRSSHFKIMRIPVSFCLSYLLKFTLLEIKTEIWK